MDESHVCVAEKNYPQVLIRRVITLPLRNLLLVGELEILTTKRTANSKRKKNSLEQMQSDTNAQRQSSSARQKRANAATSRNRSRSSCNAAAPAEAEPELEAEKPFLVDVKHTVRRPVLEQQLQQQQRERRAQEPPLHMLRTRSAREARESSARDVVDGSSTKCP